ncbi:unnamed protein product [Blepharisma stoltei]|uniref:Flavin-containing monooxygenase n=1 Tax=Blepharisma stoltei TaxID=1481888 RepID=A0AAU9IF16_9CILI|nr:unnamed protein product [Blepharisma stoltei]
MKKALGLAFLLPSIGAGYYLFSKRTLPEPTGKPYQELPKASYEDHPNKHIISKIPKTIGIIGAGMSGLISAKTFRTQGYEVEVIEKRPGPGGVWYENFDNSGLQGTKDTYFLPDYPFPDNYPPFPRRQQIKDWIDGLVKKFDLSPLIKFNTEVKSVTQNPDETWKLTFKDGTSKNYDFLVVCSGFNDIPKIPQYKGQENFKGKILHSSEFINAKVHCQGKKVIVIGAGKSAFDIMSTSVDYGGEVLGLVRKIGYAYPVNPKPYGIPFEFTTYSRLAYLCGIIYDPESSFIHKYFGFIEYLWLKFVHLQLRYGIIKELEPDEKDLHFLETAGIRDPPVQKKIADGKIKLMRGEIEEIKENGIMVKGKLIECDTIVFATGFKPNYYVKQKENDGFWLYRDVLVPGVRNVAIVGAFITTYTNLWSNIQALWLVDILRGSFKVASIEEMNKDIDKKKKIMFKYYENYKGDPIYISSQPFSPFIIDEYLNDLKIQTVRDDTMYKHWFKAFDINNYKTVVTHHI